MTEDKRRILVIEDDPIYARILKRYLNEIETHVAATVHQARAALSRTYIQGILLDLRIPTEHEGLTLLEEIRKERPQIPVIVMTSLGNVSLAVQAMEKGADGFVEKDEIQPGELVDRLEHLISIKLKNQKLAACAQEHQNQNLANLVGKEPCMNEVRRFIDIVGGDGHCTALLLGETGTGKEVVARAIYETGKRKQGPFVPVNLAARNKDTIASELFGHKKGAFTGAERDHVGFFREADGGVLFLDEIGEVPKDIQIMLLRFLEVRRVKPLGSNDEVPVDVQIITATNRNLPKRIEAGKFREDLYYRLKNMSIVLPPLRERKGDIQLLAQHFLEMMRDQNRTRLTGFSQDALATLRRYPFKGNVRELKAIVEWAVLWADRKDNQVVTREDLPGDVRSPGPTPRQVGTLNVDEALALAELSCVDAALDKTRGSKQKAQALLGYKNRQTMLRRLIRLKEERPELWEHFPAISQAYPLEESVAHGE